MEEEYISVDIYWLGLGIWIYWSEVFILYVVVSVLSTCRTDESIDVVMIRFSKISSESRRGAQRS